MKRVLMSFAAAGAIGLLAAEAAAQSIGGFPTREPGQRTAGTVSSAGTQSEVVVSQSPDSKVRTVAHAMRLVKPGGTIIVQGGVYEENLVLTKAVSIRGVADAQGGNVVFKPAAGAPCATVKPDTPMAPVSLSQVVFRFESVRSNAACIEVAGGLFSLRDSFIIPADSDLPVRAAYGRMMPELYDAIAAPQHDPGNMPGFAGHQKSRAEYEARHAQPAGAAHPLWAQIAGDANVERALHLRTNQGGPLNGPLAGIFVAAGEARVEGNVIIGAQTGVRFVNASQNGGQLRGTLANNVILGNLIGVGVEGIAADLLINRNTIRYNPTAAIKADVFDGLRVIGNELSANGVGIDLSEKVRMATISSNLITANLDDAMKLSSGFAGTIAANDIRYNQGCTIQFYSAEDKVLNKIERKVTAWQDFQPPLAYEATNLATNNAGDGRVTRRLLRQQGLKKGAEATMLAPCADRLY